MVFKFLKPKTFKQKLSDAERYEREERKRKTIERVQRKKLEPLQKQSFALGRSFRDFGNVPQRDFSQEQEAMASMFGQGDKMWGLPDSRPVNINHDLNPRQRGERGTAEMFGF